MTSDARRDRFERVAAEVVEPLRRFLARRTDHDTADDVLADVLLVCWRRVDEVPDEPLPWCYGVARRSLANAERAVRRQRRLAARLAVVDPPGRDHGADEPDPRVEALRAALTRLPARDAELLRLWAWEELGPSEIAVVLDISANAASIRLHRARQKLVGQMRKVGAGGGHEGAKEGRTP